MKTNFHSLLYFPFINVTIIVYLRLCVMLNFSPIAVMQKVKEYFNHEDEINPFRYCSRPQYGNYVSMSKKEYLKKHKKA